jgi:hypothetical protein
MIIPAKMRPIMPGIRKVLNNKGENKMIRRVRDKIRTGFFTGRY